MHIPGYKNLNQEERKITPTIRISRMIFVGFGGGGGVEGKGVKDFRTTLHAFKELREWTGLG